jgi:NAD(P)-dependent dehydrogenase (short-subunit alcohol dehydrogenase family)
MSRIEAPPKPCLLKRVSATEMIRASACSPLLGADLSPNILLSLPDFLPFVDVLAAISIDSITVVLIFLYLARELAPDMIKKGGGGILVTGNTSSIRGKADFAGFAPTKAAQRILAESMARDLGPKGIHVAYVLIDAVIDVPRMRARLSDAPDNFFIKPAAVADELWHLYSQDRSAWSFLAELRPFGEKW